MMFSPLFFGTKIITLNEVDSTNSYLRQYLYSTRGVDGEVVIAKKQTKGRGQLGTEWESEANKNLTFSLLLKPNIKVEEQFVLSQIVSLGIIDYLTSLHIKELYIKWPNDILIETKKIAGILIENTIKQGRIENSIIGVGFNVFQKKFTEVNATSLINNGVNLSLDIVLSGLLYCIEKRYLQLKNNQINALQNNYYKHLLGYKNSMNFKVNNKEVVGVIQGTNKAGNLEVMINDTLKTFDLKEIVFVLKD